MKHAILPFVGLLLGSALSMAQTTPELTPAFPGAEGYGRYTTGGRGGRVFYVTSLEDTNTEGTLRWALGQSVAKIIVFKVSGTIHLKSALNISANTTIAGQTAPGDGICVADYPVSIKGSNVIVRYLRFRLGNTNVLENGADGWDAFGAMECKNLLIDHCSVSWSIDECCSILGNTNSTLQWSIISQSLVNSGHSKGAHGYGGNWGGSGASFHHNLIIHHTSRTPRLGPRPATQLDERMDMRNNVIYNFGGNGCYGGEGMNVNIVNNYYKPGPGSPTGTKGMRIAGIGIRTESYVKSYPAFAPALHLWGKYFVEGNVNTNYPQVNDDNWKYGMYNQIDTSKSATDGTWSDETRDSIRIDSPIPFVYTTTHTADDAYERVLDYAGASLSRDSHDALMISDARNGEATYTGKGLSKGFINSQEDNRPADADDSWCAWPTLLASAAVVDTDGDGMPDEWEIANGYDPNDATDGATFTEDGYTAVEVYLNSLVDDITIAQNVGGEVAGDCCYGAPIKKLYELSDDTRDGNNNSFDGGLSFINQSGSNYPRYGKYVGIRRDVQHTIVLPKGAYVYRVKIEGYSRLTGKSYEVGSLVELAGKNFDKGLYTLPKDSKNVDTFTIDLETPVKNALTFTWADNDPCVKIWLYANDSAGEESVIEITKPKDDRWFNINGMQLREKPTMPGIYIHDHEKVIIR